MGLAPFFSIGVTTYNRRDLLKETLASVLGQTFQDYEVIVGNDLPEEPVTREILGIGDPRIRFLNYPQNIGEVANMNSLLEMARGRYFTWLADDDMYAPTFLQAVYATLVKSGYPPCVFTSYTSGGTFPETLERSVREGECFEGRRFLQLYLNRRVKTQGCYGVFDAQYLRKMGGMEQLGEGFSPYADNLLVIKAAQGRQIAYIDAALIFYRIHEQSISATSTDLDAYKSAQESLCSKSIEVLSTEGLREDFRLNLFWLLRWCIRDFATVMRRSGFMDGRRIIAYLLFIRRYARFLRGSALYWRTIGFLGETGCRLVWDISRAKFGRRFRCLA